MAETLTKAEQDVFKDPYIEQAFQAWAADQLAERANQMAISMRKQFLLRIRALLQSGRIIR